MTPRRSSPQRGLLFHGQMLPQIVFQPQIVDFAVGVTVVGVAGAPAAVHNAAEVLREVDEESHRAVEGGEKVRQVGHCLKPFRPGHVHFHSLKPKQSIKVFSKFIHVTQHKIGTSL